MTRAPVLIAWLALCAPMLATRASAQQSLVADTGNAGTLGAQRLQVGLFEPLRYGVTDRVEFFTQPLMIVLVPQVGAQVRWFSDARYVVSTRHRLSYPKPLLDTLAKEGSFGLLPAQSRIPVSFVIDLDAIFTARLAEAHRLSTSAGISIAPRGSTRDMPLLDFPFLYSRFAVLKTTAVMRLGLRYDVRLSTRVRLTTDLQYVYLPVHYGGFSIEPSVTPRVILSRHVALEGGLRFAYAHYPVGNRLHYLPFVDVICAW